MGLIYLDGCMLIYLVEQNPDWGRKIATAMSERPDADFAISPLVKFECLVMPMRRGDPVSRQIFADTFDDLVTLDMPEEVYYHAAELRAHFRLKTPDALHLACAQHHRCEALWTSDDRLAEASHGLARGFLNR